MGVCNDVANMRRWALTKAQFQEVRYITDQCVSGRNLGLKTSEYMNDGKKKSDIYAGFDWLLADHCPGDTILFHYSGHGTFLNNDSPSQCNSRDEGLVLPKSSTKPHQIMTGDDILRNLVVKIPVGVHLFAIVDACHSGTIFDLPWNWNHWNYLRSGPRSALKFSMEQFEWEWAASAAELERPYPLQGSVSLITGSQSWQTSGDMGMGGGGVLTNVLIADHYHRDGRKYVQSPGVLTTALASRWTWTDTIMEIIRHVTNDKPKAVSNTQVPNFGASHRFNMAETFTLDGLAERDEDAAEGKCARK
jgi:hypothetical protein